MPTLIAINTIHRPAKDGGTEVVRPNTMFEAKADEAKYLLHVGAARKAAAEEKPAEQAEEKPAEKAAEKAAEKTAKKPAKKRGRPKKAEKAAGEDDLIG